MRNKQIDERKKKIANYELALSSISDNDIEQAVAYFKAAIEPEDANEKYNWGVTYYYGDGVKRDINKALKWFREAADGGCSTALEVLGGLYFNGQDVEKDEKKGIDLLWDAYEHGVRSSLVYCILGQAYLFGEYVEKNIFKGIAFLEEAALANDGKCEYDAQILLANIYLDGDLFDRDLDLAEKWAAKAQQSGNIEAQELLDRIRNKKID